MSIVRASRQNDFARGYAIQTVAPLPIGMAETLSAGPTFGWALRRQEL